MPNNNKPAYVLGRTYPSIEMQLDMMYWDLKNSTTQWEEYMDYIKVNSPKPKPYPSWVAIANTGSWEAPVAYPADGSLEKQYAWDESAVNWAVTP